MGLANLYVYVLCLLAWPVKVRVQKNQAREFTNHLVAQGETDRKRMGANSARAVDYEIEL